jgi:pilus assembly protein CpaB
MNRTTRLVAVLAVALLAATVASFVVYRALAVGTGATPSQTVDTIVAAQSIPAGTMLSRAHLKVVQWPADARLEGSISDPSKVIDRGAIVSLAANEPITDAKLAAVGAGAGLPPTIPPGMRAISVRVNEVIGVAGFVVPGTRVDVVVTFGSESGGRPDSIARVVVSNAQVLTAGTRFDQEKARQDNLPIPTSVVTLLVTPEDAERIALASAEGRITLTLRNPLDTAPTASAGIRSDGLRGLPVPQPASAPRPAPKPAPVVVAPVLPPPPPAPEPYTVEAIRGAKRTTEPVNNEEEEKPRDVPPSEEKPD